jgi:hypothetical protein
MLLRAALVLVLIALAGYGAWEMRRWSTSEGHDLISDKQRRLRLWGLFFLLAVLGLWLGGTYLPRPHTRPALIGWIQYWMLTTLAALPLIPLALLDWRENLRHLAASRKKLILETLDTLPHENTDLPA